MDKHSSLSSHEPFGQDDQYLQAASILFQASQAPDPQRIIEIVQRLGTTEPMTGPRMPLTYERRVFIETLALLRRLWDFDFEGARIARLQLLRESSTFRRVMESAQSTAVIVTSHGNDHDILTAIAKHIRETEPQLAIITGASSFELPEYSISNFKQRLLGGQWDVRLDSEGDIGPFGATRTSDVAKELMRDTGKRLVLIGRYFGPTWWPFSGEPPEADLIAAVGRGRGSAVYLVGAVDLEFVLRSYAMSRAGERPDAKYLHFVRSVEPDYEPDWMRQLESAAETSKPALIFEYARELLERRGGRLKFFGDVRDLLYSIPSIVSFLSLGCDADAMRIAESRGTAYIARAIRARSRGPISRAPQNEERDKLILSYFGNLLTPPNILDLVRAATSQDIPIYGGEYHSICDEKERTSLHVRAWDQLNALPDKEAAIEPLMEAYRNTPVGTQLCEFLSSLGAAGRKPLTQILDQRLDSLPRDVPEIAAVTVSLLKLEGGISQLRKTTATSERLITMATAALVTGWVDEKLKVSIVNTLSASERQAVGAMVLATLEASVQDVLPRLGREVLPLAMEKFRSCEPSVLHEDGRISGGSNLEGHLALAVVRILADSPEDLRSHCDASEYERMLLLAYRKSQWPRLAAAVGKIGSSLAYSYLLNEARVPDRTGRHGQQHAPASVIDLEQLYRLSDPRVGPAAAAYEALVIAGNAAHPLLLRELQKFKDYPDNPAHARIRHVALSILSETGDEACAKTMRALADGDPATRDHARSCLDAMASRLK